MKVLQILPNNPYYRTNFEGYTPKQICADLCKGACCDHGTTMNANLKIIADKICASYKTMGDNLKSAVLIKAPIVKWIVNSRNPEVQTLNKLANTYIDAISKEKDTVKIAQLQESLDEINKKLKSLTGDSEDFVAVTNPELKDGSASEVVSNGRNICMFKDHDKTNLCTIYSGVKDENGVTIERPSPCIKVGSEELPCPWHNPEKYEELYYRTKYALEQKGYIGIPQQVIIRYIAEQYNLNEVFNREIWQPYLKTLNN